MTPPSGGGGGAGSNEPRLKRRGSPITAGRFTNCLSSPFPRLRSSGAGDDRSGCWGLLMRLDYSSTVGWGTTDLANRAPIQPTKSTSSTILDLRFLRSYKGVSLSAASLGSAFGGQCPFIAGVITPPSQSRLRVRHRPRPMAARAARRTRNPPPSPICTSTSLGHPTDS